MLDFNERLSYSEKKKISKVLNDLYRELASGVIEIKTIKDKEKQKKGIDKEIHCETGVFTIDEKIREVDYGDILIEVRSNLERKNIGWTLDQSKVSTYVVYYFEPTNKVIIINYKQLRECALKNLKDNRIGRFPYKDTRTAVGRGYYTTRNMGIPIYELREQGVHMIIRTL